MMLLADVAATSASVAETSSRLGKIALLAEWLGKVTDEEIRPAVSFLSGDLPEGRIGVGWSALSNAAPPPSQQPSLTLLDTADWLSTIKRLNGRGSTQARREALRALLALATSPEQDLLRGLLGGGLRQGALEGVMIEAIAATSEVSAKDVRRAFMLTGDLASAAITARHGGVFGLRSIGLQLLQPIKPMLAQTATDVPTAIDRLGIAGIEYKFDGARIQVHRSGDTVRVYTRNLTDATDRLPEIVDEVQGLDVTSIILDGEAIALREDQTPEPFQVTMSRFGRRLDVARMRAEVPLTPVFFECLHLDGVDLIDRPSSERAAALERAVPEQLRAPRIVTDDRDEATRFLEGALALGHEGVMVKGLDAPYEAGRRGAAWLKVKPTHTLDLVVLAVEWGSGRRQGWLSNIHLGARDPANAGWVMLGKTFKGMTDEMLTWQTDRFLELETHREGHVVHLRPEQVVEIAFDGLQASSRYPGGLALRFARVKGYRDDKAPEEADTIGTVRAIFEGRPIG